MSVGEAASISGVETRNGDRVGSPLRRGSPPETRRQLTSDGAFWLRGRLARSQARTSNQQRHDSVSEFQTWTLGNYLLAYGVTDRTWRWDTGLSEPYAKGITFSAQADYVWSCFRLIMLTLIGGTCCASMPLLCPLDWCIRLICAFTMCISIGFDPVRD